VWSALTAGSQWGCRRPFVLACFGAISSLLGVAGGEFIIPV
jgi:hypothetical protein